MGATPSQTRPATAPFQKKGIDQPTTRIAVALDTWPVNGDAFITLILSLATRHFPQGQFNFTFHHWSPNAPFVFRPDMPDRLAQLQLNGARPTAMQLLSIVGNVTAHFHARPVGPAGLPLCGADIFVQAVLSPKTRKTPHIGLNVTLKGPLHLLFAPNAAALGPNAIVPTLSFEQALEVAQMHPSVRSNRVETISTHAWGPGDALGWYKGSLAFYFPFGFHGCVVVDAGTGGYLDYVEPDPIGTGNDSKAPSRGVNSDFSDSLILGWSCGFSSLKRSRCVLQRSAMWYNRNLHVAIDFSNIRKTMFLEKPGCNSL